MASECAVPSTYGAPQTVYGASSADRDGLGEGARNCRRVCGAAGAYRSRSVATRPRRVIIADATATPSATADRTAPPHTALRNASRSSASVPAISVAASAPTPDAVQ